MKDTMQAIERDLLDALDALDKAIHKINKVPDKSSRSLRDARDEIKSELQKHYDRLARRKKS